MVRPVIIWCAAVIRTAAIGATAATITATATTATTIAVIIVVTTTGVLRHTSTPVWRLRHIAPVTFTTEWQFFKTT